MITSYYRIAEINPVYDWLSPLKKGELSRKGPGWIYVTNKLETKENAEWHLKWVGVRFPDLKFRIDQIEIA